MMLFGEVPPIENVTRHRELQRDRSNVRSSHRSHEAAFASFAHGEKVFAEGDG